MFIIQYFQLFIIHHLSWWIQGHFEDHWLMAFCPVLLPEQAPARPQQILDELMSKWRSRTALWSTSGLCACRFFFMWFCTDSCGLLFSFRALDPVWSRVLLISKHGYLVCLAFHPVRLPKSYYHSSLVEQCCLPQRTIDESGFLPLCPGSPSRTCRSWCHCEAELGRSEWVNLSQSVAVFSLCSPTAVNLYLDYMVYQTAFIDCLIFLPSFLPLPNPLMRWGRPLWVTCQRSHGSNWWSWSPLLLRSCEYLLKPESE